MRVHARWLVIGLAVLAVGVYLAVRPGRADDEPPDAKDVKAARDIILKATGDETATKKVGETLLDKKLSLKAVMYVFQPRSLGGVGVGKEGEINPDGIEPKLINLSKKELKPAAATKEGPALEKMAEITQTMAAATEAYKPKNKVEEKDPKDWMQFSKDMESAAADLARAAKSGDTKGIKSAAILLNKSCTSCHLKFRN
jgi:hypothetical protein